MISEPFARTCGSGICIGDAALVNDGTSDSLRLVLVGGTFLAVYGVVFLLRFLLLDQLFRRGETSAASDAVGPVSAREPV